MLLGVSLALLSGFSSATSKGYHSFLINYPLINSLPIDCKVFSVVTASGGVCGSSFLMVECPALALPCDCHLGGWESISSFLTGGYREEEGTWHPVLCSQ